MYGLRIRFLLKELGDGGWGESIGALEHRNFYLEALNTTSFSAWSPAKKCSFRLSGALEPRIFSLGDLKPRTLWDPETSFLA